MSLLELTERVWVGRNTSRTVGMVNYVDGVPTDADADVTVTMVALGDPEPPPVFSGRVATQNGTGTYQTVLGPSDVSADGVYRIEWHFELGGNDVQVDTYVEVGQSDYYDELPDDAKMIVESVWNRLEDLYDAPRGGPHLCVDEETEALTQEGWKGLDDLQVGDLLLSLDHETGLASWQPVEKVHRYSVVDEPMVKIETKVHSSLTTMSHRWPVIARDRPSMTQPPTEDELSCPECGTRTTKRGPFTSRRGVARHRLMVHGVRESKKGKRVRDSLLKRAWRQSATLKHDDQLITSAPLSDLPSDAKWSDAFVELMAWIWTEGHFSSDGILRVSQSDSANPDKVLRIRRSLTEVFGEPIKGQHTLPKWWESTAGDMRIFTINVAATKGFATYFVDVTKKVLKWDWLRTLTQSQLEMFIDISVQADGYYGVGSSTSISQSELDRLEALNFACILSGRTPRYRPIPNKSMWQSTLRSASTVHVRKNASTTRYTGQVWCPTVANGTWMARRHGTVWFTGNSVYIQTNFGRNRLAQLAHIAVGKLNTIAQPHQTYGLDPEGKLFPFAKWGAFLEHALWIETLRHLRRSYVEQPDPRGVNVAYLDRSQYSNEWGAILREELEDFNDMMDHFKIAHMGFSSPRVMIAGGIFGNYTATRTPPLSAAARPVYYWAFHAH